MRKLFCSVILLIFGMQCSTLAQIKKEEVYAIDAVYHEKNGASKEEVAPYWITTAKHELKRLRAGMRNDFENVDAKIALLESSLEEIFLMEKLLSTTADGSERNRLSAKLVKMYSSDVLADQVFGVLGLEHATKSVIESSIERLKFEQEKNGPVKTEELETFFSVSSFRTAVGLTEDQKSVVKDLISDANVRHKSNIETRMELLRSLNRDRWDELLSVLSKEQKESALSAFGHPVEWFRLSQMPEFLQRIAKDGVFDGGSLMGTSFMASGLGLDATNKDLETFKIELCPSLCYNMIFEKLVWEELELIDEQQDRIRTELRRALGEVVLARPSDKSRFRNLLQGKAEYPSTLKEFLFDEQLTWFRQVETQIRAQHTSSTGLLNAIVIREFRIDEAQVSKLTQITKKFEQKSQQVADEIKLDREAARAKLLQDILNELTTEQSSKYWKMIGEHRNAL